MPFLKSLTQAQAAKALVFPVVILLVITLPSLASGFPLTTERAQGQPLGSSCLFSAYSQCSSGCCDNGSCAPHSVCFGVNGTNRGSSCDASTFQHCDSGCCIRGACRLHAGDCFDSGRGKAVGEACEKENSLDVNECATGCCHAGVCSSWDVCWPPLAPLSPSTVRAVTDKRDTCGGSDCPSDHVCLCEQCLPENGQFVRDFRSRISAQPSLCSSYDALLSVWRNSQPRSLPKGVSAPPPGKTSCARPTTFDGGDLGTNMVVKGHLEYVPCPSGQFCDPTTLLCIPEEERKIYYMEMNDACPQFHNTPSAKANLSADPPENFFSSQGIPIPPGSCRVCIGKRWQQDWEGTLLRGFFSVHVSE